ncbi:MAG: hypothetical protein KAQ63_01060 [Candidatus Moranbacteria bacterium]|nr:hypothetical protein [Candidatus Moranbacteria bacterium]
MRIEQSLKESWLKEENEKLKNNKRKYLHFDRRISFLNKKKVSDIWTSNLVIRHSFYPLIRREKRYRKYKRIPGTKRKQITEKIRPISYAAHYDALIFSWYSCLLKDLYEIKIKNLEIDSNIKAYRKLNKGNADFASEIIDYVKTKKKCMVMSFDLSKFFDNLDHELIKTRWKELIEEEKLPDDHFFIFKNITKFSFIEYADIKELLKKGKKINRICDPKELKTLIRNNPDILKKNLLNKGIPQGSTISDTLSNLYMLPIDQKMSTLLSNCSGLYQRYCDDIIIVCSESDADKIEKELKKEIEKNKMNLNKSKTEKKVFTNNQGGNQVIDFFTKYSSKIQYLGIEFDGERSFLRHSGIANYYRKMTRSIKKFAARAKRKKRAFPVKKVFKNFFYSRKCNYLSYAQRVSVILNSPSIKEQVSKFRVMKKIKKKMKKSTRK